RLGAPDGGATTTWRKGRRDRTAEPHPGTGRATGAPVGGGLIRHQARPHRRVGRTGRGHVPLHHHRALPVHATGRVHHHRRGRRRDPVRDAQRRAAGHLRLVTGGGT